MKKWIARSITHNGTLDAASGTVVFARGATTGSSWTPCLCPYLSFVFYLGCSSVSKQVSLDVYLKKIV